MLPEHQLGPSSLPRVHRHPAGINGQCRYLHLSKQIEGVPQVSKAWQARGTNQPSFWLRTLSQGSVRQLAVIHPPLYPSHPLAVVNEDVCAQRQRGRAGRGSPLLGARLRRGRLPCSCHPLPAALLPGPPPRCLPPAPGGTSAPLLAPALLMCSCHGF